MKMVDFSSFHRFDNEQAINDTVVISEIEKRVLDKEAYDCDKTV